MVLTHFLKRQQNYSKLLSIHFHFNRPLTKPCFFSSLTPKPSSLSARMSFIFEEIDKIDKQREEKDETLQRIRSWRESKNDRVVKTSTEFESNDTMDDLKAELSKSDDLVKKKKEMVELVHPWAEWIELMEKLVQQNYFDCKRKDEDGMMESLGIDFKDENSDDKRVKFAQDYKTVQAAMINFGKDRFDILRSLSRHDLQILVGYGCPSADKRVVFSAKLLRKLVHLDEGDVCSSCSLRSTCEKAYLLTNKEEEAQTMDVMRVLLAYGYDPLDDSVSSKFLLKMKSVKTVVRKLLHEVVKLSAVPIDPNLPRPVIKRPPPKVKIPPPPPRKRVGRDDVEMKKGDWLCSKCDFMNFAKNTVCLQCDAKRPKRELLPGEWECPECNFLNYRRNTVCFHCEHNRPPDTYAQNPFPDNRRDPGMRNERASRKAEVSDAWNFDFDDNESDGADVAAFEYADSHKIDEDFSLNKQTMESSRRTPIFSERGYSDPVPVKSGVGFNDFDDEEEDDLDSYELVSQNEVPKSSRVRLSELEVDSGSEDMDNNNDNRRKTSSPTQKKSSRRKASFTDSENEIDFNSDDDLPVHPKWKSSHVADQKQQRRGKGAMTFVSDSDDLSEDESIRSKRKGNIGSSRMERGRGMSHSVSDLSDSDEDFGHNRNKQRDKSSWDDPRRTSMGRDSPRTSTGRDSPRRTSMGQDSPRRTSMGRDGPRRESGGPGGFDKRSSMSSSSSRSSSLKRSSRDIQDDFNEGAGKNGWSKFQSRGEDGGSFDKRGGRSKNFGRGGGSFDKRGGKSKNFDSRSDSYVEDERQRRPRNNVR